MKGQYIAVETVMTFGMGIAIAIGSITMFSSYRSEVIGTAREKDVSQIRSKITYAVYSLDNLKNESSGRISLSLPEEIGNADYQIVMEDGLKLVSSQKTYSFEISGMERDYRLTGSAQGGDVKLFKSGDEITVRAG